MANITSEVNVYTLTHIVSMSYGRDVNHGEVLLAAISELVKRPGVVDGVKFLIAPYKPSLIDSKSVIDNEAETEYSNPWEYIMDSETLHAWAAGFLDGDGRISLQKCGMTKDGRLLFHGEVAATQGVIEPLIVLDKLYGGTIYVIHNQFGEYWQWRVRGDNAAYTLRAILPYLVVKKRQAEIVLAFKDSVIERKGERGSRYGRVTPEVYAQRLEWYQECNTLNSRRLCRERLSERASGFWKAEDAIVRSHGNKNHESAAEMTAPINA